MVGNGDMLVTADIAGGVVVRAPGDKVERVKTGSKLSYAENENDGRKKRGRGAATTKAQDKATAEERTRHTNVLSKIRQQAAISPALQGLQSSEPEFLKNEPLLQTMTSKRFLAMYMAHVFPPRVIGQPSMPGDDPLGISPSQALPLASPARTPAAAAATQQGDHFAFAYENDDEDQNDVSAWMDNGPLPSPSNFNISRGQEVGLDTSSIRLV